MEFSNYIKDLRKARGLSARELSRRSGVSQPYLSQLETGKHKQPTRKTLEKLAKGLEADYEELMFAAGYITGADEQKIAHLINNLPPTYRLEDLISAAYLPTKFTYEDQEIKLDTKSFIAEVLRTILDNADTDEADKLVISVDKKKDVLTLLKAILKK